MTSDAILLWAIGSAVTVVVWAVRVEGRVNGHDKELSIVRDDVRYIRNRIDKAIGDDD